MNLHVTRAHIGPAESTPWGGLSRWCRRGWFGSFHASAMRQLGVEVNPPPDPVAGISGGGTMSVVAVEVESTPGSTASGAPGTARTTGGNSGGPRSGDSALARSVGRSCRPNASIGAASPNAELGATTISRHANAMMVPAEYPIGLIHATVLVGEAVLPDLRQMIDALSRSVSIPLLPNESIVSPRELAEPGRLH